MRLGRWPGGRVCRKSGHTVGRLTRQYGASHQLNQLVVEVLRRIVLMQESGGTREPAGRVCEDGLACPREEHRVEQWHSDRPYEDEADGRTRDLHVLVAVVALDGEVGPQEEALLARLNAIPIASTEGKDRRGDRRHECKRDDQHRRHHVVLMTRPLALMSR